MKDTVENNKMLKAFTYTGGQTMKPSSKNRLTAAFAMTLLGLVVVPAHADLVVNGDFEDPKLSIGTNTVQRRHIGDGWVARKPTSSMKKGQRWVIAKGVAEAKNGTWELVQVNSLLGKSGSNLEFSFTWTAPVGATDDDLKLNYALVGWIGDSLSDKHDRAFDRLNAGPNIMVRQGQESGKPAIGVQAIDLTDGDTKHAGLTVTGTAGSAQTFTFNYKLSDYAEGRNDLSDFAHLGIAFWRPIVTIDGGMLDDVSLSVRASSEESSLQ